MSKIKRPHTDTLREFPRLSHMIRRTGWKFRTHEANGFNDGYAFPLHIEGIALMKREVDISSNSCDITTNPLMAFSKSCKLLWMVRSNLLYLRRLEKKTKKKQCTSSMSPHRKVSIKCDVSVY